MLRSRTAAMDCDAARSREQPRRDGILFQSLRGPRPDPFDLALHRIWHGLSQHNRGTVRPYFDFGTTIRQWLEIPSGKMLPSARIKAAPDFGNVLTRTTPRPDRPVIMPLESLAAWRVAPDAPTNDLQKSIAVAMETKRLGPSLAVHEVQALTSRILTRRRCSVF